MYLTVEYVTEPQNVYFCNLQKINEIGCILLDDFKYSLHKS